MFAQMSCVARGHDVGVVGDRDLNDTFKWLFYGDDDTVFFLEGAMNVVKYLDPNMPYFLTGLPLHQHVVIFRKWHSNKFAWKTSLLEFCSFGWIHFSWQRDFPAVILEALNVLYVQNHMGFMRQQQLVGGARV